jgi:hypothetical protein
MILNHTSHKARPISHTSTGALFPATLTSGYIILYYTILKYIHTYIYIYIYTDLAHVDAVVVPRHVDLGLYYIISYYIILYTFINTDLAHVDGVVVPRHVDLRLDRVRILPRPDINYITLHYIILYYIILYYIILYYIRTYSIRRSSYVLI